MERSNTCVKTCGCDKNPELVELICYYLRNREQIQRLYHAYDNAIRMRAEAKRFCFVFKLDDFCRTYCGPELLLLEEQATTGCNRDIVKKTCQDPTKAKDTDDLVRSLLAIRLQIVDLYQAVFHKAAYMRSTGRGFIYTFTDPSDRSNKVALTGFELLRLGEKCGFSSGCC